MTSPPPSFPVHLEVSMGFVLLAVEWGESGCQLLSRDGGVIASCSSRGVIVVESKGGCWLLSVGCAGASG